MSFFGRGMRRGRSGHRRGRGMRRGNYLPRRHGMNDGRRNFPHRRSGISNLPEMYESEIFRIENISLWIYYISFPTGVGTRREKNIIQNSLRNMIREQGVSEGVVVTLQSVISNRILNFTNRKFVLEGTEWEISFKIKRIELFDLTEGVKVSILNEILQNVLADDESVLQNWRPKGRQFIYNPPFLNNISERGRRRRNTHPRECSLECKFHTKYEPKILPEIPRSNNEPNSTNSTERNLTLQIRPSFHLESSFPNGLEYFQIVESFGRGRHRNFTESFFREHDIRVRSVAYESDVIELRRIQNVKIVRVEREADISGIIRDVFAQHREQLEARGISRASVERFQPIFEVEVEEGRREMIIPQLCDLDCGVRIEDSEPFMMDYLKDLRSRTIRESHQNVHVFRRDVVYSTSVLLQLMCFGVQLVRPSTNNNQRRQQPPPQQQQQEEEEEEEVEVEVGAEGNRNVDDEGTIVRLIMINSRIEEDLKKSKEDLDRLRNEVTSSKREIEMLQQQLADEKKKNDDLNRSSRRRRCNDDDDNNNNNNNCSCSNSVRFDNVDFGSSDSEELGRVQMRIRQQLEDVRTRRRKEDEEIEKKFRENLHRVGDRIREIESEEEKLCSICMERPKNAVLECGHQFCSECPEQFQPRICPFCRRSFVRVIRLFGN